MALKPCRECGKDVSDEAKTCPSCGLNHPTKPAAKKFEEMSFKEKYYAIGSFLGVVGGLVTLIACLAGGEGIFSSFIAAPFAGFTIFLIWPAAVLLIIFGCITGLWPQ
jgi:hypothetical protein